MCLGVPGKIVEIYESGGLTMGKIDFEGVTREACLAYVPEARVGDYTIIHVGFALNLISEEEAQETLSLLRQIADIGAELDVEPSSQSESSYHSSPVASP
jgi:hydrogenase expression/formation protein HypC